MSTAEQKRSPLDTVKLILSLLLVGAGIYGFYYFESWQGESVSLLYRVLGLLAVVVIAALIAATTQSGKDLLGFMKNSRTEVRKMVWPTRNETMQTTLMVFLIVVLVAIFLWLVDMLLGFGIRSLLGGVDG